MIALLACAVDYEVNLVPADLGDGAAYAAWEEPAVLDASVSAAPRVGRVREEAFALGPTPDPVADFLFIIDDSVSMRKILTSFQAGIASLTKRGVFPSGSRLAVMNTTPSDFDDPRWPHPAAVPNGADDVAPGFQHLIDATRIAAYRKQADGRFGNRYRRPGCDAWFAPGAKDRTGSPCLFAHTQIPLLDGRPEAGLIALRQWLEATAGEPRFRAGAAVNVVFISDTHDPGVSPRRRAALGEVAEELFDARPTVAELSALVDEPVAAFRLHAIAPTTLCGETWEEPTYFDATLASGGVIADSCVVEDYAPVIDAIAKAGSIRQRGVLRLGVPGIVASVEIGGEPVGWTQVDGQAVEVHGALPESVRDVRVRYTVR